MSDIPSVGETWFIAMPEMNLNDEYDFNWKISEALIESVQENSCHVRVGLCGFDTSIKSVCRTKEEAKQQIIDGLKNKGHKIIEGIYKAIDKLQDI
jgi:hypothetical protein